jgi:DNA-binding NarL/FixJ family response regulator
VADDHPIVLSGLEHLFEREPDIELISSCRDGERALAAIRGERPDIAVLDIAMPKLSGLAVLRRLREDPVTTRCVILAASISEEAAVEAIALGARGLLLKDLALDLIVRCVREVHAGKSWIERNVAGRALEKLLSSNHRRQDVIYLLTPREIQIIREVTMGRRNKEIAKYLAISEGTVRIHINRIYEKLLVSNRVELCNFARAEGLV